jgi:hypothetical protein
VLARVELLPPVYEKKRRQTNCPYENK